MSRSSRINLAIAIAAVLLWAVVRATTGGVHDALGPHGAAFQTMVRGFTLKGGDKPTRLSPLLPAAAWIPFAITHSIPAAFAIVNALSMAALALAACLIFDAAGVSTGTRWKVLAASTFAMALAFAKVSAYEPANPALLALAAVTLAVACAQRDWTVAASAANVGAVMALPIGLIAPVYALARAVRLRRPAVAAVTAGPAVLMWVFVQWWARGGVSGAFADFTPRVMFASTGLLAQPSVVLHVAYFFMSAAGGLSVIAVCAPSAWTRIMRQSWEAIALSAGVVLYVIAAPDDASIAFAFLAPVWVVVVAEWSSIVGEREGWLWFAAATVVTLITQHPFARVASPASLTAVRALDVLVVAACVLLVTLTRGRGASMSAGGDVDVTPSRAWSIASYAFAGLLGLVTARFLFGMPIQLTDSFGNLLNLQGVSLTRLFLDQLQNGAYLRPLLWVQLKVVYDLAHGNYFPWFRSVQALQVLAALLMAVRLLRPRSAVDAAVLPCGLAMLLGLHTFAGTVTEAFPINTFLTLVLCCLAAANLCATRGAWWIDLLAAALLAFSILTLETGILVWLIFVVGYAAGYRGVSMRGLALVTIVLGGYVAARLFVVHGGVPGLDERATGFGFRVLQPPEVIARFGHNPLPLYLYNIVSAALTVLFAEPRGAVWQFVGGIAHGTIEPWMAINVVTSTLTTGVLACYIARRLSDWRRFDFADDDRLVLLFLAILPINAAFCAVYVKDVIMSPAGVFYALAATVAVRHLVESTSRATAALVPVWTVVILAVVSAGWGWRLLGIHYNLRARAADLRSEWGFEEDWEAANPGTVWTPDAIALKRALMDDAMWRRPAPPRLGIRWADHAFDKTQ